jgi:integrase
MEGLSARALEFAILTAARTGEVISARWDEIDIDDRLWTVPAHRMKANREHRVALSESALSILCNLTSKSSREYVFASDGQDEPLSNMALLMTLRRMKRTDLTVHGFRSTFRDWVAERTNFSREVAEAALAHAVGGKVEVAYRRGDLFEKRRALMNAWAHYCTELFERGETEIVTLNTARDAV